MSVQAKQSAIYGLRIPFGERPRSIYKPVILPVPGEMYIAGGEGSVAVGTDVSQTQPAEFLMTSTAGMASVGLVVTQDEPGVFQIEPLNFEGMPPAILFVGLEGSAGAGINISQQEVPTFYMDGLEGTLTLLPLTIEATESADVYLDATPGVVAGDEIVQEEPGIIIFSPGPGSKGALEEVVQHEPAWMLIEGLRGSVAPWVLQDDPGQITFEGQEGVLFQGGVHVQQDIPVITFDGHTGVAATQPVMSQEATGAVMVEGGYATVAVGSQITQDDVPTFLLVPGPGATSAGTNLSQVEPGIILVTGDPGAVAIDQAPPVDVAQDTPAEMLVYPGEAYSGAIGLGGESVCRWMAPPDCLNSTSVSRRILRKQPSEDMWIAYNFSSRLLAGEELSHVEEVDDGGAGIVASAVIIDRFDTLIRDEVKYRISGGTDGQNVRIQHRVLTTTGRRLEGDGFVYIREIL
jgi:hypothetical protein